MGWEDAMYVLSKLKKQIGDGITSINNNVNTKVADLKTHVTTTINKTMNDVIDDVLVPALPDNRDPLAYSKIQWIRPTYTYDVLDANNITYTIDGLSIYGLVQPGASLYVKISQTPLFMMIPVTVKGKGKVLFNDVMASQLVWPDSLNERRENLYRRYKIKIDNVFEFSTNPFIVNGYNLIEGSGTYFKDFWKFDFSNSLVCEDGYPYSYPLDVYKNFPIYESDDGPYIWRTSSNAVTASNSTPTDINHPFWTTYKQQAYTRYMEKFNTYVKYSDGSYRYKAPESKTRYLIYLA